MVATWILWVFVLGVTIGAVVVLVAVVRLPRRDDDVSAVERPTEAVWIGAVIERNGGVAPALLVEEVLELHAAYLRQARPPVPADTGSGAWATVPTPPGVAPGYVLPGYGPPGSPPPGFVLPPGVPPPGVVAPGAVVPGVVPPATRPPTPPTRR